MRVLGIETSCDETSAAVVEGDATQARLASLVILSQDVHRVFGGVVPEIASREHLTAVAPVAWGANYYGQLGLGYTDYSAHWWPSLANSGLTFRQLAAGGGHACAVGTSNAAYCWGEADYGQTGNGGIFYQPTAVSGGLSWRQVTAGRYHTCGTTTAALAYCWGGNGWGQLGDGTTTERQLPTAVASPG